MRMSFSAGVSCSQLDSPSNGHVDTGNGISFRDVASYSCINGYVPRGSVTRTCQADGQWDGTVPTCESEMLECTIHLHFCV